MVDGFKDISVTQFTASPSDQDREKLGLFHFQFLLTDCAPELWVRIASMDLGDSKRVHFSIGRFAWAHSDRIVVRCSPDEAQKIKDSLNSVVLPSINMAYRRAAEAEASRASAASQKQSDILSGLEAALKNQK